MLESEVREQARQHGIVVWLDRDGSYTRFADGLCARAGTEAFLFWSSALRGSYLEVIQQLAGIEDDVGPTPLVLHLPGHTEESIKAQQTSDWTRRPLTPGQITYAALDVEILLQLHAWVRHIQPDFGWQEPLDT